MTIYYVSFTIFSILAVLMLLDENVGIYFLLCLRFLKLNLERLIWMIRFHPNNFVTTFIRNLEYDKIARELEKEFQELNEKEMGCRPDTSNDNRPTLK